MKKVFLRDCAAHFYDKKLYINVVPSCKEELVFLMHTGGSSNTLNSLFSIYYSDAGSEQIPCNFLNFRTTLCNFILLLYLYQLFHATSSSITIVNQSNKPITIHFTKVYNFHPIEKYLIHIKSGLRVCM